MACNTFFKFRTRDRSALTGGLLDHIAGKNRPEDYVTPRPELEAVVQMVASSDEVTAAAVEYVETTKRHHKAAPCVELLIAGPPPYEPNPEWETDSAEYQEWAADRAHWTPARTEAWARANLRFLEEALPDAQIYQAAWHQDENSPHCHLAFVPCDAANRISWRQLSAAAVGMEPPKGKIDKVQQAKIMSAWQDLYHTNVGEKFGLERGEHGSTRKHEPLTDKKRRNAVEKRRIAQARAEILARLEAEKEARVEDVRRLEAEKVKEIEEIRNAAYRLGVFAERASVDQGVEPPGDPQVAAAWLIAEEKLQKVETTQLDDSIEEGHNDLVLAEIVESWRRRVGTYTEALKSGNFEAVAAIADDEPVPGYSAEDWATKKERLQEEQLGAEDDDGEASHDAHIKPAERDYEAGGEADPAGEATEDLSYGKLQENDPG